MAVTGDQLKGIRLFAGLDDKELKTVASELRERTFGAGDTVTEEGQGGVGFFVIESGEASVSIGGKEVRKLGPGDHFGELAMISQSERTATVEALTPMRCHTIQFWHFREFAKKNPDVTWKLLQHVAGILLQEQRRHAAQAESAGHPV